MPTWLRIVLVLACALLIWWLAVQLGVGVREDPGMQAPPEESGLVPPPSLPDVPGAVRRIPA